MKRNHGPNGRGWTEFYESKRNQVCAMKLMNDSFDALFKRRPLWDFLSAKHADKAPFFSGSSMYMPIMYSAQPQLHQIVFGIEGV